MKSVRVLFSVGLAFCLLVVGGFVAVSASAHTPTVEADCDQLSVKLTSYSAGGANSVKVTINGDVVDENPDFGSSYNETFDAPDQYKSYDYVVEVKAHDDPDGTKGWTKTYTGKSTACTPPANGHTPVNVCHATSSDSNPFTFITVDDDSVKLKGHLMHRDQPNKTWKSDGVFLGQPVKAGDPKPDRIGDYTDSHGVLHAYDGVITSKSQCGTLTPPVAPSGTFIQTCSPTGAIVTIGDLSTGSATHVVWTLTYGDQSKTVGSGDKVAVPSGVALALSYSADGGKSGTVKTDTSKPACPVAPTGLVHPGLHGHWRVGDHRRAELGHGRQRRVDPALRPGFAGRPRRRRRRDGQWSGALPDLCRRRRREGDGLLGNVHRGVPDARRADGPLHPGLHR